MLEYAASGLTIFEGTFREANGSQLPRNMKNYWQLVTKTGHCV